MNTAASDAARRLRKFRLRIMALPSARVAVTVQ
jgi:hypothetical protein